MGSRVGGEAVGREGTSEKTIVYRSFRLKNSGSMSATFNLFMLL